jgi:hypothetical protein
MMRAGPGFSSNHSAIFSLRSDSTAGRTSDGDQLVLGLAGEFRIRHLDRQDAGQPLAGVVAGEADLLALGDAAVLGVARERAGERAAEARDMRAAVALRDVVGEGQHRLVVAVVPPHRHLDADPVALAGDEDRLGHQGMLVPVHPADEFAHAALVEELRAQGLGRAPVLEHDADAGIEKGELAQAVLQRLEAELEVRERLERGHEADLGALAAPGVADDLQGLHRLAALEAGVVFLAISPDAQVEPVGERVDDRHADAVQPARDLVAVLVELAAGMELGHDDLGRRDPFLGVDVGGDAAAVVGDRDRGIVVDDDGDGVGMAGERLVDAVVDDLVDHVVQARAVVGVADIHPRTLAHRVQALENLDRIRAVVVTRGGVCAHAGFP